MVAADHIQVPRQHGLFHHHGIDLGDGTIAHYLEGREILRSSLAEFCRGQEVSIVSHQNSSSKRITLQRAMSRIGEKSYNLLFNNCEHFANWCKTGRHRSHQLEKFLNKSSLGALAIGQIMPATILKALNLLIQEEFINDKTKNQARDALKIIRNLKKNMLISLEDASKGFNDWRNYSIADKGISNKNILNSKYLLKGQAIAHQLTFLEDLENEIKTLIKKKNTKSNPSNYSHEIQ